MKTKLISRSDITGRTPPIKHMLDYRTQIHTEGPTLQISLCSYASPSSWRHVMYSKTANLAHLDCMRHKENAVTSHRSKRDLLSLFKGSAGCEVVSLLAEQLHGSLVQYIIILSPELSPKLND